MACTVTIKRNDHFHCVCIHRNLRSPKLYRLPSVVLSCENIDAITMMIRFFSSKAHWVSETLGLILVLRSRAYSIGIGVSSVEVLDSFFYISLIEFTKYFTLFPANRKSYSFFSFEGDFRRNINWREIYLTNNAKFLLWIDRRIFPMTRDL